MSNLDNIINKIIEDAKQEAKQLVEQAELDMKAERDRSNEAAGREAEAIVDKARSEESFIRDRVKTGIERENRDRVLQAKEKLIDRCFDLAKQRLKGMSDEDYRSLIDSYFSANPITEGLVLEIPEDRDYPQQPGLRIEKNAKLASGFRIQTDDIRINNDFEQMVDVLRESLEPRIAKMISER